MSEAVERRVLGAVRFADAVTRATIGAPLRVRAEGVRWIRNARGWWVIARAPGLEAHETAFRAPPAEPAVGSVAVELTVEDPAGRWLPRRATLALPRDPDPERGDAPDSLFRPAEVTLYPAPVHGVGAGWAVIRAFAPEGSAPMPDALLRVERRGGGEVLARGMTDARGEALVAIAGIPATTWDEEGQSGVLATEVEVRVSVLWDRDAPRGEPPDPDALEGRTPAATMELKLASGRTEPLELAAD